jgi:hypothetical protein
MTAIEEKAGSDFVVMSYFEQKAGSDRVVIENFESISVPRLCHGCTIAKVSKAPLPMESTTDRLLPKTSKALYATSQRSTTVLEPTPPKVKLVLLDVFSTGAQSGIGLRSPSTGACTMCPGMSKWEEGSVPPSPRAPTTPTAMAADSTQRSQASNMMVKDKKC